MHLLNLTVEWCFPAFEDLDHTLLPSTAGPPLPASTLLPSHKKKGSLSIPSVLFPKTSSSAFSDPSSPRTGSKLTQTLSRGGGVHSEQATGSAPLESRDANEHRSVNAQDDVFRSLRLRVSRAFHHTLCPRSVIPHAYPTYRQGL
jgi:hypothetical protein